MELYVFPNIDDEKRNRLREAGVQFSNWRQNSILIEGDNSLHTALEVLNAKVVSKRAKHQGLIELVVKYQPARAAQPANGRTTRNRAGQPREASRRNYIKACSSRLAQMRKAARNASVPVLAELRKTEARYIDLVRKSNLADLTATDLHARFTQEMEQIRGTDKVKDVRVLKNGFIVFTDRLVALNPDTDTTHDLGEFAIVVRFSGQDAGVFWINRTRRVDTVKKAMHAPNIFPDGTSCNDEVKQVMLELIGRCEFASLVDIAIQFVETINPENPLSKMVTKWPVLQIEAPLAVRGGALSRLWGTVRNFFRRRASQRTANQRLP